MPQKDLAERLGLPKSRISELEAGKFGARFEERLRRLLEISRALECDLISLLTGAADDPKSEALSDATPVYLAPGLADLVEAISEIMESGQQVVIDALVQNIRAFRLSARALGRRGKGASRAEEEGTPAHKRRSG